MGGHPAPRCGGWSSAHRCGAPTKHGPHRVLDLGHTLTRASQSFGRIAGLGGGEDGESMPIVPDARDDDEGVAGGGVSGHGDSA